MLDAVPTALERVLAAGTDAQRPTPYDALGAARHMWLADQRIDMGALAASLGISRATLYNWVGDRDRLITEVLWSLTERTYQQAREAANGTGAAYISDVIEHYLNALADSEPTRRFIERDPEFALGVLTSKRTTYQRRLIAVLADLIAEQMRDTDYVPPLEPESLAYVLIRIGESFIFNDVITGSEPDLSKAIQASRVLLHAAPLP